MQGCAFAVVILQRPALVGALAFPLCKAMFQFIDLRLAEEEDGQSRSLQACLGDQFAGAAQPVAVKWAEDQEIVWPTEKNPVPGMKFSTEENPAPIWKAPVCCSLTSTFTSILSSLSPRFSETSTRSKSPV